MFECGNHLAEIVLVERGQGARDTDQGAGDAPHLFGCREAGDSSGEPLEAAGAAANRVVSGSWTGDRNRHRLVVGLKQSKGERCSG